MENLNRVLTVVLEIGGAVVVLVGAIMWIIAALKRQTTARSFMALVFTFVFFTTVVLGRETFGEALPLWTVATYGGVLALYIIGRTIEHHWEVKAGHKAKAESA
jgi:hypothetical protein